MGMLQAVANRIFEMAFILPIMLVSLPAHELAHGYAAYRMGDSTAKLEGRLTLNPFAHLDPLGVLAFVVARIGWAKPVPINPLYFKNRKIGICIVSIAGPLANIFLAIIFMLIYSLLNNAGIAMHWAIVLLLQLGWQINALLAVFNLLPIPPLDGSKILGALLPNKYYYQQLRYERYGFLILLALIFTGILPPVLNKLSSGIINSISFSLKLLGL